MAGRKTIINPHTMDKGPRTSQAQHFLLSQLHLALLPQVQPIKQGEDAARRTGSHFTLRGPIRRSLTYRITAEGGKWSLLRTGRNMEGAQACFISHCRYILYVCASPKNTQLCSWKVNLALLSAEQSSGLNAAIKGPRAHRPCPHSTCSHSLICFLIHSLPHFSFFFFAFHC